MEAGHSRSITAVPLGAGGSAPLRSAFGRDPAAAHLCVALLGARLDRLEHLPAGDVSEAAQRALGDLLAGHEGAPGWTLERRGDTWWALIPDVDARQALVLARELAEAARLLRIEADGRGRRLSASCAVAHSRHRSQPSLATCVAVVEEGLRVAAVGGGRRAVHSEVYEAFAHVQAGQAPDAAPPTGTRPPVARQDQREVLAPAAAQVPLREVELSGSRLRAVAAQPPLDAPAAGVDQALEREWSRRTQAAASTAAQAQAPPRAAPPAVTPPVAPRLVVEEPADEERAFDASELLHRRLTKLTRELERAETEIARLRARVGRDAAGLASIYREVQGLSEDAPLAELKRSLMARIFEANVELRDLVRQQG